MLNKLSEMWGTVGWKMAYAGIVVVAITMLIVMFS